MKRILLAVMMLFAFNVAHAEDTKLLMSAEACEMVYTVAEITAKDVIKEKTIDTFDFDSVLQLMAWDFYNELEHSAGLRERQLVSSSVAVHWLRSEQITFRNQIKRSFSKYGNKGQGNQTTAEIVADALFEKCGRVTSFVIPSYTLANPKGGVKL